MEEQVLRFLELGRPLSRLGSIPASKVRDGYMKPNKHRFRRVLAIVLIAAGFIGQLWSNQIWNHYLDTLPRAPDVATARTYRDDNFHGYVLYETREEHLRLYTVEYLSEALVSGFASRSL